MKVAEAVEIYIGRKTSTGAGYRSPSCSLRSFARRMGDLRLQDVTASDVKQFVEDGGKSLTTRHEKHHLLRRFYEHWLARGEVSISPVPTGYPKRKMISSPTFIPETKSSAFSKRRL